MNRLGMIVNLSHVANRTFWDALETSKAPIFASHSSCRAISDVPRNMTDDMIAALGKKGGVVQINFDCGYLNQEAATAEAAQMTRLRPLMADIRARYADDMEGMMKAFRAARGPADPKVHATLADVVKHINHVVDLSRIDHVGLGSDFDGVQCVPEELNSVDKWPRLTRALLEEGYSQADIIWIYGENTLRLMSEVEKTAAAMK
jgi:membrane dipeptidase